MPPPQGGGLSKRARYVDEFVAVGARLSDGKVCPPRNGRAFTTPASTSLLIRYSQTPSSLPDAPPPFSGCQESTYNNNCGCNHPFTRDNLSWAVYDSFGDILHTLQHLDFVSATSHTRDSPVRTVWTTKWVFMAGSKEYTTIETTDDPVKQTMRFRLLTWVGNNRTIRVDTTIHYNGCDLLIAMDNFSRNANRMILDENYCDSKQGCSQNDTSGYDQGRLFLGWTKINK